MTSEMAEYGFYQFYHSALAFKWMGRFENLNRFFGFIGNEIYLEPITMEQLKKPIIIFSCLNGFALLIFIAEILLSKWLKWRCCKY